MIFIKYSLTFRIEEIANLMFLAIISNFIDTELSSKGQAIYFYLLNKIIDNLSCIKFNNYNEQSIKYYESIPFEEKIYYKSIVNGSKYSFIDEITNIQAVPEVLDAEKGIHTKLNKDEEIDIDQKDIVIKHHEEKNNRPACLLLFIEEERDLIWFR